MKQWKAYENLARYDHIIADLEEYEEEVRRYKDEIESHLGKGRKSMLHFGSGAGGHDYHLKQDFDVTGVDVSEGMLEVATGLNPQVTYVKGDMRDMELNQQFDVVFIPESIMYMTTLADVERVLANAERHLKPRGLLLVMVQTKEEFQENNFVYSGKKDGIQVDLFENNTIVSTESYEAVMVYLIREDGELTIESDVHTLGLFPKAAWVKSLSEIGAIRRTWRMDDRYDHWIEGEGEYPQTIFTIQKS